jgi:hypothetical protein
MISRRTPCGRFTPVSDTNLRSFKSNGHVSQGLDFVRGFLETWILGALTRVDVTVFEQENTISIEQEKV